MEAIHTNGPWHVSNGNQIRSARDQIAKVWMMRDGEGLANAKLIAASPDLINALILAEKALNEIRVCCHHTAWDQTGPAVIAARAAIAKATE